MLVRLAGRGTTRKVDIKSDLKARCVFVMINVAPTSARCSCARQCRATGYTATLMPSHAHTPFSRIPTGSALSVPSWFNRRTLGTVTIPCASNAPARKTRTRGYIAFFSTPAIISSVVAWHAGCDVLQFTPISVAVGTMLPTQLRQNIGQSISKGRRSRKSSREFEYRLARSREDQNARVVSVPAPAE